MSAPIVGAYGGYPYGASYATPFASPIGYGSSALALDAADGVIDGRCFGAPIASPVLGGYGAPLVGATTYAGALPYTGYAGAYATPVATSVLGGYGGYGAYGAYGVPRVASITRTTVSTPVYGAMATASPALALDAADGVIDGRYFGAPIASRVY
jgi:hypothetical protein